MKTLLTMLVIALSSIPVAAQDSAEAGKALALLEEIRSPEAALTPSEIRKRARSYSALMRESLGDDGEAASQKELSGLFRDLVSRAVKAQGETPPRTIAAATAYDSAGALFPLLRPETLPAADSQAFLKKWEDALDREYDDADFLAAIPWQSLSDAKFEWKADEHLRVSHSESGIELKCPDGGPAALYRLNDDVHWRDADLHIEFTATGGFQVIQRVGRNPCVTHDLEIGLDRAWSAGKKSDFVGRVFAGRFRAIINGKKSGKAYCPPTGNRTGGCAVRVPPGTTVTLHKIEVRMLKTEDSPGDDDK